MLVRFYLFFSFSNDCKSISSYLDSDFIFLGHFQAGYRYTFNIYGCTDDGDRLLEMQTGYSREFSEFYCVCVCVRAQALYAHLTNVFC